MSITHRERTKVIENLSHPEGRQSDSIRKNTRKQATGTADYRLLKAYNVKNKAPNTLPCQFFPLN